MTGFLMLLEESSKAKLVTDEIVQVAFQNCTISSVIQHVFYRLALAWAGQLVNHKALLLIIAILIAMGLTLLGLVLVARDTNILSCFVWSRGRVTNSRSQGIRFKSGAARLTSPEET